MTVTILSPLSKSTLVASWLDVHTITGSRIILPGHEPLIAQLAPAMELKIGLSDGTVQTLPIKNGILSVNRQEATIILDE